MKKIFNLEKLIYLAVFLLPAYLVRLEIGILSVSLWEMIVGAALVFWIWKRSCTEDLRKFYRNYKKYVFCAGFILAGLISSLAVSMYVNDYVINYVHSAGIIISWFLAPVAFLFLTWSVVPKGKIVDVFTAYYFSAAGVAFLALGYFLTAHLTYDGRLQGIFNSPNYLAMYLAPALITGLAQVRSKKLKVESFILNLKNILWLISLVVILAAFYFTYSYAAWLSTAVAVLGVLFVRGNISLRKLAPFVLILFLLVMFQMKSAKFIDLITNDPRSSLASRVMIWKSAAKMIASHPVFGIGPGNFQNIYLEYQKYYPPYLEWAVPHPHNLYLAFWLYGGVLGLAGFLAILYFFFCDIWRRLRVAAEAPSQSVSKDMLYVSLGIMLYILLHGLFDTTYFKNDLAVVFWLCFLAVG